MPPTLPPLPITPLLPHISQALAQQGQTILQAPPGAGKTTLVPLYLMQQAWLQGQKILLLEPRRVAARTCAAHMASLLGEKVGQQVGLRIRQHTQCSAQTRLEVITGGVFIRMLQDDPSLEGVGLVIFDECHERSLDSDLGLALCLHSQQLFRSDGSLRLLAMSATLDTQNLQHALPQAPLLTSEGRQFPVSLHHGKTYPLSPFPLEALCHTIEHALKQQAGDMLVFLPGQREIQQLQQHLSQRLPRHCQLRPLYSGLTLVDQQKAIAPVTEPGERKIVLATNIAETSLTIEGVTLVVDSGLCREPQFHPSSGLTRLHTQRISRASATQRAGRAGRLSSGQCFRLWSAEQVLNEQSTPEILQADLAPLALQLISWGINDPNELTWLTPPPTASYRQGLNLLLALGAIEEPQPNHFRLTASGQQMQALPLHPRLAHMLVHSPQWHAGHTACWLAALLSESARGPDWADLAQLLDALEHPQASRYTQWQQAIAHSHQQFSPLLASLPPPSQVQPLTPANTLAALLALAYPDRIAKRRDGQARSASRTSYLLANGRAASLDASHPLAQQPWLVVAETHGQAGRSEDTISRAAALNPNLFEGPLANHLQRRQKMHWDTKLGRFIAVEHTCIGALVLKEAPLTQISPAIKRQALVNMLRETGLDSLPWCDTSLQLQARVALLRQQDPHHPWPDLPPPPCCSSWTPGLHPT